MYKYAEVGALGGKPWFRGDTEVVFGQSVPDESGQEAGLVASWKWNGETLEVHSDRHGYLPLYYQHDEATGRTFVSDSALQILASVSGQEFDLPSLAFFCRAGFLLGNRTLYRDIHRVPAGSILRWSEGSVSIESNEPQFEGGGPTSIEDAVDGWIERFQVAMHRRQPFNTEFAMPLSGGRDSRMMLMELRRLGHSPSELVSHGPGSRSVNDDLRIASELAERLELPHNIVRSTRGWVDLELERHAWCGTEALEHAWLIPLWSYLTSNHTCWYDGLGVGAMTRNSVNTPEMHNFLKNGQYEEWCDGLFAKTAAPSSAWIDRISSVAPIDLPGKDAVIEYVRDELSHHLDAPNPTTRFTFTNWGRRAIALSPFGICRGVETLHTPLMDRDLVNWAASVPAEMSFANDLQTEACKRLYPEIADVPFNGAGSTARSATGMRQRVSSWMDKARFFATTGKIFQGVASEAMRVTRRDPSANDALGLMGHLVLADACREADRARDLISCTPTRHILDRRLAESVA